MTSQSKCSRRSLFSIVSIILSHCLVTLSEGNSGSVFENLGAFRAQTPRDTYQGCVSGCLHPRMSVEHLLEGRFVSGNAYFPNDTSVIPPWTNLTLFALGQKFARQNVGFLGMSHLYALIFDNFIPDVKLILLGTGTTASPEGAAKRFTATASQVVLWYQNSLEDPLQKKILLDSLHQVRRHHLDASFKVLKKFKDPKFLEKYQNQVAGPLKQNKLSVYNDLRFWTAFVADIRESAVALEKRKYPQYKFEGVPISQFGHAMTQFSFAGMVILFRRQLGLLHVKEEELRAYVHVWAVLGHALGIQDEYNICLQASLEESEKVFRELLEGIAIPALFQMDETSHILISAYLDGLLIMNPMLTPGLMGFRFLRDIAQVKPTRMLQNMNIIERFYVAGMDGLLSDNLMWNKWFANTNGAFFVDVNGYKYFGRNYTTDEKKSRGVFYTREKVAYE